MSIVIVGGNDCMERRYLDTCESYGCRAKVFTQMRGQLKRKFGSPDLVILFTGTVSHKMVVNAMAEAKRCHAQIERSHTSSLCALQKILQVRCQPKKGEYFE